MSRHFPSPESKPLTLSDGSSIEVKKRITAGEERESFARMYRQTAEGTLRVHPLQVDLALVTCYLVDWNLVGDPGDPPAPPIKGKPVEEVESALNNLDVATWDEIVAAIKKHEAEIEAARLAKKKSLAGASAEASSSPSPSDADGTRNGSSNSTSTTSTS